MSARTILTLANRRGIDLRHPTPADYSDFEWQAEHLAKENRYNGATPGVAYSVAQHLCLGMDAIIAQTGDRLLAAYFGIHDAPEGALKDDPTPKKVAIAEEIEELFGLAADKLRAVYKTIEARHEAAVHVAAGLEWPMPAGMAERVKYFDLVMFVTEWRDLMHGIEHPDWAPYEGIPPLRIIIKPWEWQHAQRSLMRRWRELLPALGGRTE